MTPSPPMSRRGLWPEALDYRDALQHPDRAFRDPVLRAGTVECNRMGVPRGRSGTFANVYKLTSGSETFAVRLFLYEEKDREDGSLKREDRYRIVHDHLQQRRPASIVSFKYDDEGIRIGAYWFPVLTMDWVEGDNLSLWVRNCVQQGDTVRLRRLADQWGETVEQLLGHEIAHGDLQHDNVLVVNDRLVLVDYDCMCVPGLVNQPALEWGKPGYQHPRRLAENLSLSLDHFSAWIILIGLRAVAADPNLWQIYVEKTNNENLLFREADIFQPANSDLWTELLKSPDREVRSWAKRIHDVLREPFDRIPRFSSDPFAALGEACAESPPDWEKIERLGTEASSSTGRPVPVELQSRHDEACRRVRARADLEQAIQQARGPRAVAAVYNPALVDDWPACDQLVAQAREARDLAIVLDRLDHLVRQPGDGRELVREWERYQVALNDVPDAAVIQTTAESWGRRLRARDAFLEAIHRPGTEREIANSWELLQQAGGHADAEGHRERAELAKKRADRLDELKALPKEPGEKNDRQWRQKWNDELLRDCREADAMRQHHATVNERLHRLDDLLKAVERADQGTGEEQAVAEAAARLPTRYRHRAQSRVDAARIRLARRSELSEALDAHVPSERAIAAAWESLDPVERNRLDPSVAARCQQAVLRRNCLDELNAIDSRKPLDVQDEEWLARWNEDLLRNCAEADPLRARYQLAGKRVAAWQSLKQCLDNKDPRNIRALAGNRLLVAYPPVVRRKDEIDELLQMAEHVDRLDELLSNHLKGLSPGDLEFLRQCPTVGANDRARIEVELLDWLHREENRLKPGSPPSHVDPRTREVRIRWLWPGFGVISQCWLAVNQKKLQSPEETGGVYIICDAEQHRRHMGSGGFAISSCVPERSRTVWVTIWAVIDLGWMSVTGPPLNLGPFNPGRPP